VIYSISIATLDISLYYEFKLLSQYLSCDNLNY